MKKIIFITALFLSTNGFANFTLHNFNEIKKAVTHGHTIHIVVDFSKCTSAAKPVAITTIGMFTPHAVLVKQDQVAMSLTHFTVENPNFSGKAVTEFVRYTFKDDEYLYLTSQILDAVNYAPLSDKISFECKIHDSVKVYD